MILSDALDLYFERLGLPEDVAEKFRFGIPVLEEGLVWLGDLPLMVKRGGSDFVVDSDAMTKLLVQVNSVKLPVVK